MSYVQFLIRVNNFIGYLLIATIILSPIGFIQVILGYLLLVQVEGGEGWRPSDEGRQNLKPSE